MCAACANQNGICTLCAETRITRLRRDHLCPRDVQDAPIFLQQHHPYAWYEGQIIKIQGTGIPNLDGQTGQIIHCHFAPLDLIGSAQAGLMYNAGMVRMIEDGKDGTTLSHPKRRDVSCMSLRL